MSLPLEAEIRDILALYPDVTKDVLRKRFEIEADLLLRSKEKILDGRADLVFDSGNELFLLELKIGKAKIGHYKQLAMYCEAMAKLVFEGSLPRYESINACLLATEVPLETESPCEKGNCPRFSSCGKTLYAIEYDPREVLSRFAEKEISTSIYHTFKPVNLGAYRFYFNKMLRFLYIHGPLSREKLLESPIYYGKVKKRQDRLETYLKEAEMFDLIEINNNGTVELSEFGKTYSSDVPNGLSDPVLPDTISEGQAESLRDFIVSNPSEDRTIYGIYSFAECVYELSKNTYPIPAFELETYFTWKVGKMYDWHEESTRRYQVSFFGQYCEQLGLTVKLANRYYITPSGVKLMKHLYLNKIKEMI